MRNIGFIGVGHMGSSLVTAIADNKEYFLYLNNRSISKIEKLAPTINNSKISDYQEIFDKCEYIFIGVKPVDLENLLKIIKSSSYKGIIISMVAGVTIKEINNIIENKVIRIMPNTPVAVKSGITLFTYSSLINEIEKEIFKSIMKETGLLFEVEEDKINPLSVITGSAPAYFDYFIDAVIKAGVNEGLNENELTYLTLKMLEGVIKLNLNSNKSPLELGKEVCSPNGSTIEGVNILMKNNIYKIIQEAYLATLNKNNHIK